MVGEKTVCHVWVEKQTTQGEFLGQGKCLDSQTLVNEHSLDLAEMLCVALSLMFKESGIISCFYMRKCLNIW